MGSYGYDDRRERDNSYSRSNRGYRDDDDFSFRGASHRGGRGGRDGPRRSYGGDRDRDYHGGGHRDRGDRYSRGGYDRGWAEEDHVVREPTPPPHLRYPNGDEHVATGSNARSQLLLIRRLKMSANRQVLIKGLNKKLCRDANEPEDESPLGANPASLRAIYFICDRENDHSLGYAFAEFHSVADAQAALRKAEVLGEGCTVASQRFYVDYADLNAFPIVDEMQEPNPEFVVRFRDDEMARIWRVYCDGRYYAAMEAVELEPPEGYVVKEREREREREREKGGKGMGEKKRVKDTQTGEEPRQKKARGDMPVASNQFATWSRKQAELRKEVDAEEGNEVEDGGPAPVTSEVLQSFLCPVIRKSALPDSSGDPTPTTTTTTTTTKSIFCFLCSTLLPHDLYIAHVIRSRLHQGYLHDTVRLDNAYAAMKRLRFSPDQTVKITPGEIARVVEEERGGSYVDRAKMRREKERAERRRRKEEAAAARMAVGEGGPVKFKMSLSGSAAGGGEGETDDAAGTLSRGIGASMLRKHGWTDGAGLGTTGRAAPVETMLYAAGVGLGHETSNQGDAIEEANRATKGEGNHSFAEKTMSSARMRFRDMEGK